jgi:hypothetical protein
MQVVEVVAVGLTLLSVAPVGLAEAEQVVSLVVTLDQQELQTQAVVVAVVPEVV